MINPKLSSKHKSQAAVITISTASNRFGVTVQNSRQPTLSLALIVGASKLSLLTQWFDGLS
jgi:hypothetical protein